jgi:hypothetical protein
MNIYYVFDNSSIQAIRKDLKAALNKVAEKYDISVDIGTIRYDEHSFRFQVKAVREVAGQTHSQTTMAKAWIDNAPRLGLPVNAVGTEVMLDNEGYTVMGLKPRNYKKPVIISRDTNSYKISVDHFNELSKPAYEQPLYPGK